MKIYQRDDTEHDVDYVKLADAMIEIEAKEDAIRDLRHYSGWRPIAELPDDNREYVFWDDGQTWLGNCVDKMGATHFLAPPPKPDPFEVWWATWSAGRVGADKHTAHIIWNAAWEAKP